MILTEEQAKEKLCPLFTIAFQNELGTEESIGCPACSASKCMMWRWFRSPGYIQRASVNDSDYKQLAEGYCGLAGKELD